MAVARTLRTQTEEFWRDEYEVSENDLDLVTSLILDAGKPQRLNTLISTIILRRFQREKEAVARQARAGHLYQPKGRFEVGQEVVFSGRDFAVGRIVAMRPGNNPRYGAFEVVRVAFEDESEHEFAANFDQPHPLNQPAEQLMGGTDSGMSEAEMLRRFEHYVAVKLEPALRKSPDVVYFDGAWFLHELLPEIHIGYLNLAEAMIYEANHPLAAREMLNDLDLPATGSAEAQLFALNRTLGQDARFANVSMTEDPVWYLKALMPRAAFEPPAVLKPAFRAAGGEYLGLTMLDLVEEVDDELDELDTLPQAGANGNLSFEVSFPHLYAGTMPLNTRLLRLLPASVSGRVPLTVVDTRTARRFDVWAMLSERYVVGLGEWYAAVGMCVGGQVTVIQADERLTLNLTAAPVRARRSEWIRSATAEGDTLVLQMQRATVEVRCDRNMLVDIPDRDVVVALLARHEAARTPLTNIIRTAFNELAKLSSRGIVHAKSIYSVANLLRRTGCVPVFAELTRQACYDPVGDGFWAYEPSLTGTVYHASDEMRERPLSRREDVLKDQVVQYLGR